MTTSPPITVALERAIQRALREVHTTIPAMVESYDEAAGTCAAQPLILKGYRGRDGKRKTMRYPVVPSAPVIFGGVKRPLTRGSIVLLLVSEACIDRGWDVENDPEDDRRFDLNDAFALPIVTPGPEIEITETEIRVGGSEPLVKRSEFLKHTHLTAATGPATPPSVITPGQEALPATFPGTTTLKGG
jgi:hypothetical protein